jgi:hypothetical protein
MNLQVKLKVLVVGLSALTMPWSLYIAYCFGGQHYTAGALALVGYVAFDIIYSIAYWCLIERIAGSGKHNKVGK